MCADSYPADHQGSPLFILYLAPTFLVVKSTQCKVDHRSQFWACRAAILSTSTCLCNLRAPPAPHTSPEFFSSCKTRTLSIPVSQQLLIPLCLLPPVTTALSVISATLNTSRGMVPGLSPCSWLISLSIVSSRFSQVVARVRIKEANIPLYV